MWKVTSMGGKTAPLERRQLTERATKSLSCDPNKDKKENE